jgi:hypothetical protein
MAGSTMLFSLTQPCLPSAAGMKMVVRVEPLIETTKAKAMMIKKSPFKPLSEPEN